MKELDTVVLTHSIPEHGLRKGDIGTAVHIYRDENAFEIEFTTGEGRTVGVLTLAKDDIRSIQQNEILHVRSLTKTA